MSKVKSAILLALMSALIAVLVIVCFIPIQYKGIGKGCFQNTNALLAVLDLLTKGDIEEEHPEEKL